MLWRKWLIWQARIRDVSVIYDCFKILEKLVTLCRDTRIIGATKSGFLESIQNLNLVPWWNISGGIENNRFQIFKHLWGIYQKNVNIFELQQWLEKLLWTWQIWIQSVKPLECHHALQPYRLTDIRLAYEHDSVEYEVSRHYFVVLHYSLSRNRSMQSCSRTITFLSESYDYCLHHTNYAGI